MITRLMGRPKNIFGKAPVAAPIVQACTNPCSAMLPRIRPRTMGEGLNP